MTVHELPQKKSAEQLTKAADDLLVAWELCKVLHGYLCTRADHCDACDAASTVVELVGKRVEKARDRIGEAT